MGRCALLLMVILTALAPAWAVREGDPAPDFSLPSLTGDTVSLSSFRGKVTVLVFWASWSKSAPTQLGELNELEQELGANGVAVLALNQREQAAAVKDFKDRHQLSLTMLLDDGAAQRAYGVNGLPDLWVRDRKGTLRMNLIGYSPTDMERIRSMVEELVAESDKQETAPPVPPAEGPVLIPAKLRAYAHLQLGAAHINIGDAFVKAGYRDERHFDEALREFKAGVALEPDNLDLHIWLGLALERKGDQPGAAREYQAVLKLDPTNAYAQDALRRLVLPASPTPSSPNPR